MLKLDLCHVDDTFWTSTSTSTGGGCCASTSRCAVESSTAGTLLIKHNVVQWRNETNHRVLKQFTCESVPLAAVFFPFQARVYNNDPVVVILVSSNLIRFHTIEGQIYELVLNFIAKNIYPSALGLLVERESLSLSRQIYSPNDQKHFMYSVTCPDGPIRPIHSLSDSSPHHSTAGEGGGIFSSSFSETIEHDCKQVVCVWDRFVCVFDETTSSLAIHALQAFDSSQDLLAMGTAAARAGAGVKWEKGKYRRNSSAMLGDPAVSFVSSHSSDSRSSSNISISDHSSLLSVSSRSNSTDYSSLRRRPKKQARGGGGGGGGRRHSISSSRSSSPVSFAHSFAYPPSQPMSQHQQEPSHSRHSDILHSLHSGEEGEERDSVHIQAHHYHQPMDDNLPPDVLLCSALATLQLGTLLTTTTDATAGTRDKGKDTKGHVFSTHFSISFSVSPVGTILLHLLSLHSHDLRTYAFFPALCDDCGDSSLQQSSARLKLLCTRPSVRSLTHIYLGKQKRFVFGNGNASSDPTAKASRQTRHTMDTGRHILVNSPGFRAEEEEEINPGKYSSDRAAKLMGEAYRGATLTNEFNDFIGTLLLSTRGECDLVIGISPSIIKIDIEGSLTNCPFNKLLRYGQSSGQNRVEEYNARKQDEDRGVLRDGEGYFSSALNHFQDCVDREGALLSSRLPQHRPNVVLLLRNSYNTSADKSPAEGFNGSSGSTANSSSSPSHFSLYNFSLPFWSFLHSHPLVDCALPTENSQVLDSPPLMLHSLFTALANSMMFLLRKMTSVRELDMILASGDLVSGNGSASSNVRKKRSTLMEPIAATLTVLLALENEVGTAVAGTLAVPLLVTVVVSASAAAKAGVCSCSVLMATQLLSSARALVACGCEVDVDMVSSPHESDRGNFDELFIKHADFLQELVQTYYAAVALSYSLSFDSNSENESASGCGDSSFGSVLVEVLHMLLEDEQLQGLNTSRSNAFQCALGGERKTGSVSAATKAATASMCCLFNAPPPSQELGRQQVPVSSYARYYSRLVQSMQISTHLVESALALFPSVTPHFSHLCDTVGGEAMDVSSSLKWLQAALHLLPLAKAASHRSSRCSSFGVERAIPWSPFAPAITRVASSVSPSPLEEGRERGGEGAYDVMEEEESEINLSCVANLGVCGSGSDSVTRQSFLTAFEASQLLMPRLALLRCFLTDLSWRLAHPTQLSPYHSSSFSSSSPGGMETGIEKGMDEDEVWVQQCLVGSFLKCCQFAAEYLDETKGQAVLNMFPLTLKLAIQSALFCTRNCLVLPPNSNKDTGRTSESESGCGYSAVVHPCLFCPFNPVGWPGLETCATIAPTCFCFSPSDESNHCNCRGRGEGELGGGGGIFHQKPSTPSSFPPRFAAYCTSTAPPVIVDVSLQWPLDILQLVGREDYIANSAFSSYVTAQKQLAASNPQSRGGGRRPNSVQGPKQLQDAEDLLFTAFPHLLQLNQRDFEDGSGGSSTDGVSDFSTASLSTDFIKTGGGKGGGWKMGGKQSMGGLGGDVDGLKSVDRQSVSRFAEDERMKEACRLLRSSKTLFLKVERSPEATDVSHRDKQQQRLLSLCRRSLAFSVGRGMLTLSSLDPLMAEHLPIPPLALSGRVPPTNAVIALDTASAPPELTLWPEFHNGVAAGLRVRGGRQRGGLFMSNSSKGEEVGNRRTYAPSGVGLGPGSVTRNWILYNRNNCTQQRPQSSSHTDDNCDEAQTAAMENAHAGSLLAFGLLGHLSVLNRTDITEYLTKNHEPTSIAMLIGLAASKIGSADPLVSRTLRVHLPSLLFLTTSNGTGTSMNFAAYQASQGGVGGLTYIVSPLVQTAALTGLGLLNCGTGHRLMVEFLLTELVTGPSSGLAFSMGGGQDGKECVEAREAMALAAGWALGMVLLSQGKGKGNRQQTSGAATNVNKKGIRDGSNGCSSTPLSDLRLEDRLQQCIEGGRRETLFESQLFNTPMHAETHSSLAASRDRHLSSQGGGGVDPSSKSSRSLETDFININITAPGAIMALTLMYLKSNNRDVAARIAVPHTLFALDNIRPDLLIYRAMSTCLILWEEGEGEDEGTGVGVKPTTAWMRSKLPALLLQSLFTRPLQAAEARAEAVAAATTALEEKEKKGKNDVGNNDDNEARDSSPQKSPRQSSSSNIANSNSHNSNNIRSSSQTGMSVRSSFQALVCIMTGNAWGLALRYAGTSNSQAKSVLLKQLRFLQCLRDGSVPPIEVVDFLCSDDLTYSRLLELVQERGKGERGKERTASTNKKVYNPIFHTLIQAAADKASKAILETCVTLTALSTAAVLAGSGDLDTLTLLRILRNKVDETTFGTHMGIGMAIGLLFLGQGRASLRRDPLSIGALLLSMSPRFPTRTPDNQNHLQALRHLYVLATEERCLSTLDVDLQQSVSLEVEVCLRTSSCINSTTRLRLKSPTLLPELSTVASITVCSTDHYEASIQFEGGGEGSTGLCALCNPGRAREVGSWDSASACKGLRLQASPSSSLPQAADLQQMQRCSRCPNATVLYVKRKEAEVWNQEGNLFQNAEKCKKNAQALRTVQHLDTTAAGSASLVAAVSWLRDRMSLSNRRGGGTDGIGAQQREVEAYLASKNPLLGATLLQRQLSLDSSLLHAILSHAVETTGVMSSTQALTHTEHKWGDQGKRNGRTVTSVSAFCLNESVELGLLRIWARIFPSFAFSPPCQSNNKSAGSSQDKGVISFSKILHVSEQSMTSAVMQLCAASSLSSACGGWNLVELFVLFLSDNSLVSEGENEGGRPTISQQLRSFFSILMVSWGIPLDYRLTDSVKGFVSRCLHDLDTQREEVESAGMSAASGSDMRLLLMSRNVSTHLEAICLHIVVQMFSIKDQQM